MDEPKRERVRDWLTRAKHDLRSSRALTSLDDPLLDTAIYRCQQAAEKSVKGWLQLIDHPFPKTHDIKDLVKRASGVNPEFRKFAKAGSVLAPYVSAFRIQLDLKNLCQHVQNLMRRCNRRRPITTSC